jgi:hypothetical protein
MRTFTTPAGREAFFRDIEHGFVPPVGTAMAHARDSHVPLWGSTNSLRFDCARIMAAEVAQLDPALYALREAITPQMVEQCQSFQRAFFEARNPDEANLHNNMVDAFRGCGNPVWDTMAKKNPEYDEMTVCEATKRVAYELRRFLA